MFERFTERARAVVAAAQQMAQERGIGHVGTQHLLLALVEGAQGPAAAALKAININADNVREQVDALDAASEHPSTHGGRGALPLTPRAKSTLEFALREALSLGHNYVGEEHLLLGMLRNADAASVQILTSLGVDLDKVRPAIVEAIRAPQNSTPTTAAAGGRSESGVKDGKALKAFARNLTEMAEQGRLDPVIGRFKEVERIIQILGRRTKNNPILVGSPGVGKTAVIEGLAQRINAGEVPEYLLNAQVYSLDLAGMVAGTKYRGEFEARLKALIKEIDERDDVIVFIDEIHSLVGAGAAEGAIDAASILKPALARGEMRVIGATTHDEYMKYFEKDQALVRRFQKVEVAEPSPSDTVLILKGLRERYEQHHGVEITDDALEAAVSMSARYIPDRQLPDKAIDLVDEAAARLRISVFVGGDEHPDSSVERELASVRRALSKAVEEQAFEDAVTLRDRESELAATLGERGEKPVVGADEIAEVCAMWTGIPVQRMTETQVAKLVTLEDDLHKRLIGQEAAVSAVSKAVRRARAGIRDSKRPTGSFIFLGPTGVGKTELAKALAELVYGDEEAMVRIDMSEYMEKHAISRLIGSPPGYVGHDAGGQLTEAIRRRPYTVVLLDEIEKAHPDVSNILLQLLEDGRITDGQGRKVDCSNTLVIMTSNLGAQHLVKDTSYGFGVDTKSSRKEDDRQRVMGELKKHFRPELLNRIDESIVFERLTREQVARISELLLGRLKKQLGEQGLHLELTDAAKELLLEAGYDPTMGARPMRRAIQRLVEDHVADTLLAGRPAEGSTIIIDVAKEAKQTRATVRAPRSARGKKAVAASS